MKKFLLIIVIIAFYVQGDACSFTGSQIYINQISGPNYEIVFS